MTNDTTTLGSVPRVGIFIDGSNFSIVLGTHRAEHPDYRAFLPLLVGEGRRLARAYYYGSRNPELAALDSARRFQFALTRIPGMEVRQRTRKLRQISCPHCGTPTERYVEKGVDVELSLDMLCRYLAGEYDIAVLVTHDSDFLPAIDAVRRAGGRVELVAFPLHTATELVRAVDAFRPLQPQDVPVLCRDVPDSAHERHGDALEQLVAAVERLLCPASDTPAISPARSTAQMSRYGRVEASPRASTYLAATW